ncbi:MAG: hypothetical protein V1870_00735 [Candidatus Aenigmatarchaeota archaeon]
MLEQKTYFISTSYASREEQEIRKLLISRTKKLAGRVIFHGYHENNEVIPIDGCIISYEIGEEESKESHAIGKILYEDDLHSQSLEPDCVIQLYEETKHFEASKILLDILETEKGIGYDKAKIINRRNNS